MSQGRATSITSCRSWSPEPSGDRPAGALLAAAAPRAPQTVLTIDPKHRLVEGVASDGNTIWVSSILDRQILACKTTCRTLATLPAPLHPFAIAWDQSRKRLVGCRRLPAGRFRDQAVRARRADRARHARAHPDPHRAAVGQLPSRRRFGFRPVGVFVSDSQNGVVFRLLPNGTAGHGGQSRRASARAARGRRSTPTASN